MLISGFQGRQPQVTVVMNLRHYFLSGPRLPSQLQIITPLSR